jgi:CheY-like chemotaxis protein
VLQFYVKDTGIGIPESMKKIIFERFRQAESYESRTYQGAGLGLSITQSLVKILGGTIWVESEYEKGSTFSFTIPVDKHTFISPKEKVFTPEMVKKRDWTGLKILIAEDNEVNFILVEEILKPTNITISRVTDGKEALDFCQRNPSVDFVLMDINMPVMDGFEATRLIKTIMPHIPIIACTAYAMEEEKEKCLEAGCDDYVSKPIVAELLFAICEKYICQKIDEFQTIEF